MSAENYYFKCTIRTQYEDAKGKLKYRNDQYIVQAIGPTDVEAKIATYMKGGVDDYEISSVVQTKIVDIVK